ncbi:MAG: hypothetical protein A3F31_01405 [Candidatus Levybacteria bacterium RIFCSPHIGHO2_12_FULL_38_12]|nr:MAG: hypothetical protein A3D75_00320 [Candidatus Levybacteria bacterium RIFCSPHIGHO2_02_FULL_37_18]OGH22340.1 MAG: hypothetical protein A3F31_01405 [Candidatus Levybacteria bacterium RIFCSPHIGHO2_12_FULL_38_12]OGH34984.1 MAG: hypothetical protein A3A47_03050 [Candidatus Levybacteria bacterium RIFCSPLOWO2_01_FULL_37_20]
MLQGVDFNPGDKIKVHQKITEGEKTRTQVFEGVVLGIRGRGENKSFMVRKVVGDIAIERIWPVGSPNIEKVVLSEKAKKRAKRAKLYHLRKVIH